MRIISQKLSSCPRCTIAAFGICFVALIVVLFVVDLRNRHWAAINGAEESASNFAQVLAEHTARTFEAVDRSLREGQLIRENLLAHATEGVPLSDHAAKQALRHLRQTSPLLISIGWTDTVGNLVAHSNEGDAPRANLANMPHFLAQRDAPEDKLFIAQPFQSPLPAVSGCRTR